MKIGYIDSLKWKKKILQATVLGYIFIYVQIKYEYIIYYMYLTICEPGSAVGIATGYGLDGPGIESR